MVTRHQYPNSKTIERHVLSNGMIVLLYQNPNAKTAVIEGGLWAGAVGESAENGGTASMVASSLMRGTANRTFEQIYDELEGVGASLGFGSGYQMSEYSAESLPEDLDLLLDILADTLRNPIFPADEIEKVRKEKLTSIYMSQNNTNSMAHRTFRATLYGDHPYGQATNGTLETVPTITPADLADFHKHNYAPDGQILTIVSGMPPATVLKKVEAALGDWRNPDYREQPTIPAHARPTETVRVHHAMPDKTQSDIILGLPGPVRSVPDYFAARMANSVLGVFGMMGRLGKSVRERQGLAYYVRSSLAAAIGPVPWYVSTGVAPEKVEQALGSIKDEIHRIQDEPVSAEELADSQAYATGSLPMSIETSEGLADIIFNMEFLDLGLDYLTQYDTLVNSVTVEQVQAAAQAYFSAEDVVISVAGP